MPFGPKNSKWILSSFTPNSADKWDQLYELVKIFDKKTPDKEGIERYLSREDFDFYFTNSKTTSPETIFIATYENKMVGITVLDKLSENEFYTGFTGVLKEHRGNGIAFALKHFSIEYAQTTSLTTMRTNNHSKNLHKSKSKVGISVSARNVFFEENIKR